MTDIAFAHGRNMRRGFTAFNDVVVTAATESIELVMVDSKCRPVCTDDMTGLTLIAAIDMRRAFAFCIRVVVTAGAGTGIDEIMVEARG